MIIIVVVVSLLRIVSVVIDAVVGAMIMIIIVVAVAIMRIIMIIGRAVHHRSWCGVHCFPLGFETI